MACNFIKKRLQHGCFPVSIPKVLGTIFFIEQLPWLLLIYVLVSKRISKKESGEIAFDLISLFHVQINTRAYKMFNYLQNFIITNYLKQDIDDDLSVCGHERSPCSLSITGDIKIYQCHVI